MIYRIFWALVLAGVVVGVTGWWLDWDFSKTFSVGKNWPLEGDSIVEAVKKAVNKNAGGIKGTIDGAVENQKEAALQTLNDVSDSLVATAQKQAEKALDSLSKSIGLNGIKNQQDASLMVAVAIRVDEKASFLLRGNSSSLADYDIDWGDGNRDSGAISGGEEKIIEHRWKTVGDHMVSFGSGQFLVRVLK